MEPDSAPRGERPEADSMNLDLLCWWFDRSQNVGRQLTMILVFWDTSATPPSAVGSSATFFIGTGRIEIVGISGMAVTRF